MSVCRHGGAIVKMSEVEERRVYLASLLDPTRDELNELRDCEITLGMTMASPKARSEAARRCEARDSARRTEETRKAKTLHHATRKTSPAQLDREIAEALSLKTDMSAEQIERYRSGRKWGWPADLSFKVATDRPLSRTPGRGPRMAIGSPPLRPDERSHSTIRGSALNKSNGSRAETIALGTKWAEDRFREDPDYSAFTLDMVWIDPAVVPKAKKREAMKNLICTAAVKRWRALRDQAKSAEESSRSPTR